ncbi:hypothetical protein ACFV28_27295 [Streptomyces sp. NPDC059720]|uniref:hypothetical protein n=1 Tax=Streptomyces sp. NPDC059720 TaxID=3346924 RepID=UPI003696648C
MPTPTTTTPATATATGASASVSTMDQNLDAACATLAAEVGRTDGKASLRGRAGRQRWRG